MALGVGFGLELLPGDTWLAFLLAYAVGLFVLPIALVILGFGALRSMDFPAWAKWVPLTTAVVGAITYGFHTLAPEVGDPGDGVWYTCIGICWLLLGLASLGIPYGARIEEATANCRGVVAS
jgi:hypothetical protein